MFRLASLPLCVIALWTAFAPMADAQTLDGFATLPYLATADPDAALDRIGTALDAMEQGEDADPRVIYDLYDLAADLLVEGGQAAQAGLIRARLADFSVQYRDFLGVDPLPAYTRAVALLRDTAQDEMARDTVLAMYDEQRAGGAAQGALAETGRQIAQLSEALGAETPDLPGPLPGKNFQIASVYYATNRAPSGEPDAARYFRDGRDELSFGRATVTLSASPGPMDLSKLREVRPLAEGPWSNGGVRGRAAKRAGLRSWCRHRVRAGSPPGGAADAGTWRGSICRCCSPGRQAHLRSTTWPTAPPLVPARAILPACLRCCRIFPTGPGCIFWRRGMGAQVLAGALERIALRRRPEDPPRFDQVILAAPDMDAEGLIDILPDLHPLAKRITLYASNRDWSMRLAQRFYGSALRAGWGGEATLTDPAVDSVDFSAPVGDLLTGPGMLSDLAMLLWRDVPPQQRCGLTPELAGTGDVPVWKHEGGICGDPALIGLLAGLRHADVYDRGAALAVLDTTVSDPALRGRLRLVVSRLWPE